MSSWHFFVIPANAGIQVYALFRTPAYAGVTGEGEFLDSLLVYFGGLESPPHTRDKTGPAAVLRSQS